MLCPNFLIVGAPKCGTTALYRFLQQHPNVFMPERKEPYYFIQPKEVIGQGPANLSWKRMVDDPEVYRGLFKEAAPRHLAVGEASAGYLYFYQETIPNIQRELGDPKILILIRDPVARAFSSHIHHVRAGRETKSFREAWKLQEQRAADGWWFGFQLRGVGLYADAIAAYQSSFSQVKVILQDDLSTHTETILQEVYGFLGLSSDTSVDTGTRHNQNLLPRSQKVKNLALKLRNRGLPDFAVNTLNHLNSYKPVLSAEDAKGIAGDFQEDLVRTGDILNRDVSHWLNTYLSV